MRRRSFLMTAAAPVLGAVRPASYGEQFPDMLLSYLAGQLNARAAQWDQERAKIRTAADVEARNRFVREKSIEMLRGLPERTPLNPVTGRVLERDGYRVENIMFQSRPDFRVPANLYVPAGNGPFPGIISPCGHSALGRTYPVYQSAYIALVKAGFVVLAYDAIGQGERRQYWNPQTNRVDASGLGPTYEHSMPGQLLILMGENLTHYRVWDGMRAIDYLLTRREVDPARIGCTGNSGGGTLTLFISAVDERVKCAAMSEGGSVHRWPSRTRSSGVIGPADVEQNLFPSAVYGIDTCDLHAAIAPRPLLVLIENYSARFNETAAHVRARYAQLGAGEKFATEEAADPHAWTPKLRVATVDWFSRWFYGRRGPAREPEFATEKPENLNCLENGSLRYSRKGSTIFTLIQEKGAKLPPSRKSVGADEIRKMLRYTAPTGPLGTRILVTTPRKGYDIEKVEFLSEPGIYIPAWVFLPERNSGRQRAVLYLSDAGKEADGMEFGLLEKITRQGQMVVAVDVRGIGETRPPHTPADTYSDFRQLFDVETAMAYMAWFMDRNLFGMRVQDVVRSVDYVLSRTDVEPDGVRVIARGMGSLWALYAAALDRRIASLVCERPLLSYRSLTAVDKYKYGANVFLPDVLLHFDLPHVAAAVADRPLALVSPLDAMKHPVKMDAAQKAYAGTIEGYAAAGVSGRFRILPPMPDTELFTL